MNILQPNGRFETGKKICLSMSAHHPETWQPSWSSKDLIYTYFIFDASLSVKMKMNFIRRIQCLNHSFFFVMGKFVNMPLLFA